MRIEVKMMMMMMMMMMIMIILSDRPQLCRTFCDPDCSLVLWNSNVMEVVLDTELMIARFVHLQMRPLM